jgi:hypothetical protein
MMDIHLVAQSVDSKAGMTAVSMAAMWDQKKVAHLVGMKVGM